jgi:hypothetical protein
MLPADTLSSFCYSYMFSGCTGLTTFILSSKNLDYSCYSHMFEGCTGLT